MSQGTRFLKGTVVAKQIYQQLKEDVRQLKKKGITPGLAVILVGRDPQSVLYARIKGKKAKKLGIAFRQYNFSPSVGFEQIKNLISRLNKDRRIHGIVIQLPLPGKLNTDQILNLIKSEKDVDGLVKSSSFTPPAALAILKLFRHYRISLKNKKVVLIGRGRLVGRPLEKILKCLKLSPRVCDIDTKDIQSCCQQADIIITATGSKTITADFLKQGTIVVDAAQDVRHNQAILSKVSWITPRFGGVGPLTVAILLANLTKAAKKGEKHASKNR